MAIRGNFNRCHREKSMNRILRALTCAVVLSALGPFPAMAADATPRAAARHKVIFQVSDNDPAKWNLALNNARNIQQDVGSYNVDVEVVAYGPGLNMLKLESEVSARVGDALRQGVKIMACENTMANTKVSKADML